MTGKIRIQRRPDALSGHSKWYQVFLDDTEITNFVRSVEIKIDACSFPSVKLEIIGIVEIPDDIEADISIYKRGEDNDQNTQ